MMKLKHLSPTANDVLHESARRLDTWDGTLVKEFEAVWRLENGDYSQKLVEYCCSKALRHGLLETKESIVDSSFSRFTFDIMLAWQMPKSEDEYLYMERVGKEKEDKKSQVEANPAHEDVPLFYSDIMPLLVDHGPAVQENTFVWFCSVLPLPGDVANGRFIFSALTATTAHQLHYPAYDKFLKEIDKCVKHLQKQETPKGVELADGEFILHVEGTAGSQRVVRHIGGTSWPGRLALTNYALYFEASGTISYEDATKFDLSKHTEQSVKPAATGPWGAPLFDKAMLYEASELSEGLVLEFPEITSSTRRDHWLTLTKEIILLHKFLSEHELKSTSQAWEMHSRTILGIIRLHAAREMLRMAPPSPTSFLIVTLFDELPKGDFVLGELAENLKLLETSDPCSASSILRLLNMSTDIETLEDSREQGTDENSRAKSVEDEHNLAKLGKMVNEASDQAKEIQIAKATTEGLREEGVADSAVVLAELLKPLNGVLVKFQEVVSWQQPGTTVTVVAAVLLVAYKEWIGKMLAVLLVWAAIKMFRARQLRVKDKCDKVVVCTATDQTTMESIVSAQHGIRTAHDLVQQANIAILKVYSIWVSRAPKHANMVITGMVAAAVVLAVVPFKYFIMAATLYLFAVTSMVGKNTMTNEGGNRRLKEWWDSIPVVPVKFVDDPAYCK